MSQYNRKSQIVNRKSQIFCVYFDKRPLWQSDCVIPIQAGRARTGVDLGILADDTGDNISNENRRYGEMTAWYWVWKNYLPQHPDVTYVGFSHYRRFLDLSMSPGTKTRRMTYARFRRAFQRDYGEAAVRARIGDYDLLMRRAEDGGYGSLRGQFLHMRPKSIEDFDRMAELIRQKHPQERAAVDAALASGSVAMELQFIMRRDLFDDFMSWAFSLCRTFEQQSQWHADDDGAGARAPAFLIERFFMVWLALQRARRPLRVLELPLVKLTGRPWWFPIAKPFIELLPKHVSERIYGRYK